jgi:hypothetical protein
MGLWEAECKLRKILKRLGAERTRIDQIWKKVKKKADAVEKRRLDEEIKNFPVKKAKFKSECEAAEFRKNQRKKHEDLIKEFESLLEEK